MYSNNSFLSIAEYYFGVLLNYGLEDSHALKDIWVVCSFWRRHREPPQMFTYLNQDSSGIQLPDSRISANNFIGAFPAEWIISAPDLSFPWIPDPPGLQEKLLSLLAQNLKSTLEKGLISFVCPVLESLHAN